MIIEAVIRGRGAATGYSRLSRVYLPLLPRSPEGGGWQKIIMEILTCWGNKVPKQSLSSVIIITPLSDKAFPRILL